MFGGRQRLVVVLLVDVLDEGAAWDMWLQVFLRVCVVFCHLVQTRLEIGIDMTPTSALGSLSTLMSDLIMEGAANSTLCFRDCTDAIIVHFLDFAHFVNIDGYASLTS